MNLTEQKFQQIIKSATKVAFYRQNDPETALFYSRKTVEAICQEICLRGKGEIPRDKNGKEYDLNDLINLFKNEKIVPSRIIGAFKTIQNYGNSVVHGEDDEIGEHANLALNFVPEILEWYFADYEYPLPESVKFNLYSAEDLVITSHLIQAYSLFGFETQGSKDAELWQNPMNFHNLYSQDENDFRLRFNEWQKTKRKFTIDEILNGKWVKVAHPDHGHQHRLKFHRDNSLQEWSLFSTDENDYWTGTWKLEDGVLKTSIAGYEEVNGERRQVPVGYELEVFASRDGIHSAVENYKRKRVAYFKVFHIKD